MPLSSDLALGVAPHRPAWLVLFDPLRASSRLWAGSLLACVLATAASYQWLDRPVAQALHGVLPTGWLFHLAARLPDLLLPGFVLLALLVVVLLLPAVRARIGRPVALGTAAYVSASLVKGGLKFAFGRTWAETWVRNNPSWLRDGVYGFTPFHGGAGWSAFPSGHMCVTMALAVVAWYLWPRLRPLTVLAVLAMEALLVGLNFHWLSDTIAGAWLGTACGVATMRAAMRWVRQ